MPHTCSNCSHWRPINPASLTVKDMAGECRARPPVGDWKWPRCRSDDYCSEHSEKTRTPQQDRPTVAFEAVATPAPQADAVPPERAGEDPRAPLPVASPTESSPPAPEVGEALPLTLDAADDGQAPAPATGAKTRRGRQA